MTCHLKGLDHPNRSDRGHQLNPNPKVGSLWTLTVVWPQFGPNAKFRGHMWQSSATPDFLWFPHVTMDPTLPTGCPSGPTGLFLLGARTMRQRCLPEYRSMHRIIVFFRHYGHGCDARVCTDPPSRTMGGGCVPHLWASLPNMNGVRPSAEERGWSGTVGYRVPAGRHGEGGGDTGGVFRAFFGPVAHHLKHHPEKRNETVCLGRSVDRVGT